MTGRDRLLAGLSRSQRAALLQRLPQPRPEVAAIPATGAGRAPLSFAQQRLWFIDRLQGADPTYNMPLGLAIRGAIDIAALARALHLLAARHDALRLRLVEEPEGPSLEAVPAAALDGPRLELVDLSAHAPENAQAEAAKLSAEDARRPFDLGAAPLLRATLICLASDHHHLLLTFHHIISDGWSNGIALRDLVAFYVAARDGRAADLPAITHGYLDYARWQRDPARSAAIERQTAAWQRRLEGAPAGLDLATDFPRPAALSYRGGVAPFVIDAALTASLSACCRAQGASLFMGLLGIYATLLCRHGGGSDLVIGSPIANRLRPELEPVLGFFANTLALRVDLDGDPSFNALLARIRRFMLDAYSDQEAPFEQLVDRLAAVRALDRTPLFEALLVFQQAGQGAPPAGLGLAVTPLERTTGRVHFPLALGISEVDGRLEARLGYQTDLFAAATAERLARHFLRLVSSVIAAPDAPLSQLAMLSEEELAELARLGAAAPLPEPIHGMQPPRLAQPFSPRGRRAAGRPDEGEPPAPSQRPPVIRAAEADASRRRRWRRTAAGGRLCPSPARGEGLSLRPTPVVQTRSAHAIAEPLPDLADIVDITGQRFASAIAVEAADGTLTYAELAERSGHLAQALLAQALTPNQPVGLCAERGRMLTVAMLAILKAGCPVMPLDPALPPGRLAVLIAEGRPQRILAQARCCAALPAEAPVMLIEDTTQAGHQQTTLPASPDGLAYVLFTSGSTGLPKGVAMGRRAFGNVIAWQQRDPVLGRAQRTAQFAALGFDVSFQEMLCCWATGGTLVLVDEDTRRDPHALWQWLAASRIERLYLPVVALQHLAEAAALAPEAGPPLADVIVAGEALVITPKIRALFVRHPCRLHNHYGPTETHVVTFEMLDGDARTWPERPAIGKPLPGCFVRVAGPGGEVVPLGVAGELWLGGAQLAEGYLGRPDLTAERFVSDAEGRRFYRTGDRVRQRPDGNLDYLGRLDDQVKIRGFRVEPGEIAAALGRHPAVAQAAVIADDGQRLVAFVVAAKGENIDAAVLRDHVAKTLPGYMVPAAIVAADALPLTASGKLDRRALRMPAPAPAGPTATEAPRTPTERRLAGLWEEVLGISAIGLHDNFFDLGGHSLLAARLAARIRRELAVELPLRTLFEAPTIAKLAAVLDATATRTPDEAIAPVPRVAEMPCSFAQERLWFLSALEGASATYSMPGVIRLTGTLDLIALQACLSEIVRRHEVLRTRLVERDGHVMQIIDAAAAPPLPLIDLTGQPATAREEAARQWIDGFVQRPFDLARDRPVRFALLRHGPADHVLLVVIHHVAADGWSFGVLAREATALYAAHVGRAVARLSGAAAPLPALPIQYADFAAWQRRRMTGETLQAHRDYWRQQLAGAPARLDLPVARPRPDVQSFHGARLRFALGVEETTRLRDAARHHAVTPHTLLLTAYAAMLHRLSGRDDFIITTPTANRTRPEIEPLIGFFINMLPIRVRLTPGMTFAALIGALHHTMLDALAHQDLPFEKIVEDFSPNRSLAAQTPLTEIVFVLQSWPHVPLELPGLTIAAEPYRDFASKYDLTLSIDDGPGGITGTLEYATDLFDAPAAGQMVEAWRHLLQLLVVTPDAPVLAARLHTPAAPGDDFAFDESPP